MFPEYVSRISVSYDYVFIHIYCLPKKPQKAARLKTGKTRKFFPEIFKFEFSILPYSQNRKLGNRETRNNISEVSEFSNCHFFIFQKTFFFSIFYSRQFRTFYLRYVLFSRPLKVFFPSPKIYVQNITLS